MGVDLSVRVPPDRRLPPWPRVVRWRRGASSVALRRARRQHRRAGHRQPRLEAEIDPRRRGAARADRHLQRGARLRRRRQSLGLDALDRFHHAQKRDEPALPRRRSRTRRRISIRAPPGQFRTLVDADPLCRLVPQHARRGRVRRRDGAGRQLRRRAHPCRGPQRMAVEPARATASSRSRSAARRRSHA